MGAKSAPSHHSITPPVTGRGLISTCVAQQHHQFPTPRVAMPKVGRLRKLPVTLDEKRSSSSTPRASRSVIRRFHTLLKQQKTANGDTLADVNREIEELGGLEKYQHMSCIGQSDDRGGGSEKVLIGWLKLMGWAVADHRNQREEKEKRQQQKYVSQSVSQSDPESSHQRTLVRPKIARCWCCQA